MTRLIKWGLLALGAALAAAVLYGGQGYWFARQSGEVFRDRADALIAAGRGAEALGEKRLGWLLAVEDPALLSHAGADLSAPGAGMTAVTQALAKRLAFVEYRPGIAKIRQTGFAMGLESELSKPQILALWLDGLEMGEGPDGWMTGFFAASEAVFGAEPAEISEAQFLELVAVLISPARLTINAPNTERNERVRRIERLIAGLCEPDRARDVWLDGCAGGGSG